MKKLEIGDFLTILPMHGRKRTIKLTRKSYIIKLRPGGLGLIEKGPWEWELPGVKEQELSLELIDGSYQLQADEAVRHNGNLSFKSPLHDGDVIDFQYNRLLVAKEISLTKEEELKEIPSNIIVSPISVLIEGETGTGKSRMAKKIHEASGRAGEFVHLNLSSFSPNLIESELFGHEKGAFTGAMREKRGAFLRANKGTLFLDEIDSISKELQTKLLLVLESAEVLPVGGEIARKFETRLIFASGRKVFKEVEHERMRLDFYYRIASGFHHTLKPLRENNELLKKLLKLFELENRVVFSERLVNYYLSYTWPGNIRQFVNHLRKKAICSMSSYLDLCEEDYVLEKTLLFKRREEPVEFLSLDMMKRKYAKETYTHFNRSIKKSAEVLGIAKNTMRGLITPR